MCSTDDFRPMLQAGMRVDEWAVYTDGQAVIAVPADGRELVDAPDSAADTFRKILTAEPANPFAFDLAQLREWCGPVSGPCTHPRCHDEHGCICPDCGCEHTRACPRCRGTGIVDHVVDRHHVGRLGGVPFNRRLLALLLDGAPGESVCIAPGETPEKIMPIIGEGWRGGLMPFREDDYSDRDEKVLDSLALSATES
jgi:hypothetical protein